MRLGFTTSNQSQREHQWSGAIPTSPRSKKFKFQQSAGKVMVTVFWDSVGVIVVDFMSKGATINLDVYIDTSKKLKATTRRVRPALEMSKVLLQHNNARLYCKESLRGQHFSSDEEVKTAVWKWLKTQFVEFYNKGCGLVKRWEKSVWKAGNYIEK